MRKIRSTLLLLLPAFLIAQNVDSIAIYKVDSLLEIARSFTSQKNYKNAIEQIELGEKIALKN